MAGLFMSATKLPKVYPYGFYPAGFMNWSRLPLSSSLPLPHRIWRSWLVYGPKRPTGTTIGGNILFRLVRRLSILCPQVPDNYLCLSGLDQYILTIDLLDFECFNHTIPAWSGGSSESRLLRRLLRPGDVFADIGANYGLYALLAAHLGGLSSRILAFEPQPRVADTLRRSAAVNGFTNLEVIEAVVGDVSGNTAFYSPSSGSGIASISQSHASQYGVANRLTLPLITIDSLQLERLDLVKMDIEGSEPLAIKGAAETLLRTQPIIWLEINPSALRSLNYSPDAPLSMLAELGYKRFLRVEDLSEVGEISHLTNVVAVPANRDFP